MKDTTSAAEKHLYELLRSELSDEYSVFHSVSWQNKDSSGRLRTGETDFLILHPSNGILLLEVKGGGIDYDGVDRQWWGRDRTGEYHEIKDPFQQASVSAQTLKRFLKSVPATQAYCEMLWLGYGVWFPDISWPHGSVTLPHAHDDLVLDANDVKQPEQGLQRLYAFHEQGQGQQKYHPLSDDALAAIESVLAPTIHITSRLADRIAGEERRITELTEEQFEQFDSMRRFRRLAIQGAAGTGKTVLAIEKARRLALQGQHVLLLCFNTRLAQWIKRVFQDDQIVTGLVYVHCLDDLCQALGKAAGLPHVLTDRMDSSSQKDLAKALARNIKALKEQGKQSELFDAILVDEGQDIETPFWPLLNLLLRDKDQGMFYVFFDPAQRDLPEEWAPPNFVAREKLRLTMNCRNTQSIFHLVKQFYRGLEELRCTGPLGDPVWFNDPMQFPPSTDGSDPEVSTLQASLDELLGEGIAPEDMLIISCRPQRSSSARQGSRWYTQKSVGPHPLTWDSASFAAGKVAISTIRSAKGLERKVVILAELDGLDGEQKRDELLYIALSRATHRLVVLGSEDQLTPRQPALWAASTTQKEPPLS